MRAVIKLGGDILAPARGAEAEAIAAGVHALVGRGDQIILVHGGGPQTTELQRRLGTEPNIVAGRRITDAPALEAIKMVVGGQLNIDLCGLLTGHGVRAIGLNGASAQVIAATRRPPRVVSGGGAEPIDFGHVGDVVGVNRPLLELLLSDGYTPVLACIGGDPDGRVYNINADIVATQLASVVAADRLLLITGAPGVLRDRNDPATRIDRLTVSEGRAAINDGSIVGGMIPKLDESFKALEAGVPQIQIVGGLGPGDLLRSIDQPGHIGTTLVP